MNEEKLDLILAEVGELKQKLEEAHRNQKIAQIAQIPIAEFDMVKMRLKHLESEMEILKKKIS